MIFALPSATDGECVMNRINKVLLVLLTIALAFLLKYYLGMSRLEAEVELLHQNLELNDYRR